MHFKHDGIQEQLIVKNEAFIQLCIHGSENFNLNMWILGYKYHSVLSLVAILLNILLTYMYILIFIPFTFTDKMLTPVWEDVQNGSMNSYPLNHGEDLIGSSVDSVKRNEERLQVREDGIREISKCSGQNNNMNIQVAQSKPELKNEHSTYHRQSQALQTRLQSQVKIQNIDLQNYSREPLSEEPVSPKEQTKQECNFSPDQHSVHGHITDRCSSNESNINLQDSNETHSQESQSLKQISQAAPIEDMHQEHSKQFSKSDSIFVTQERLPRPVMKRKHGGPIEDNHGEFYRFFQRERQRDKLPNCECL